MSYEPTIWKKGDKVTSTKLNKIENGIQGNDTEISDLKEGLSAMYTATSSDVGKALKAKTVTDGKVTEWEFGEAGGADPEEIEQAVTDWLDDHPEAVTTVEDGSLTVAKFTESAQAQVVNNYVTPEMFGAKGDGVTDDTQAIKDMLASGAKNISFGEKSYKITDSIDFATPFSTIHFNNTKITVDYPSGSTNTLIYAVGFKTAPLQTIGTLNVECTRHAYICIWLEHVHGSMFDALNVSGGIIWGIYLNHKSSGNNTLTFNNIRAQSCGITLSAYGKYESSNVLALSGIDYSRYSGYIKDAQKTVVLNGEYNQNSFIIDDSDYNIIGSDFRMIYCSSLDNSVQLDANDPTTGVYNKGTVSFGIRSDYSDGDNGRKIAIPIGGGVYFASAASEGGLKIGRMSITSCSCAFCDDFPYGLELGVLMVESCTMMFATRTVVWYGTIGYIYTEALGTYLSGTANKNIMFVFKDSNSNITLSTSSHNVTDVNTIMISEQDSYRNFGFARVLPLKQLAQKNVCYNASGATFWGGELNEFSPDNIVYNATALSAVASPITLNLSDTTNVTNRPHYGFSPKRVFVRVANAGNATLKIGIKKTILDLGYSINGAVNNVLTVDGSQYGRNFVVTILLFGKVFYVTAEALNYVDNTTT